MDFKRWIDAPVRAGKALAQSLTGGGDDQSEAKAAVLKHLMASGSADIQKFVPKPDETQEWSLPPLDDSLTEDAKQAKAEAEARGEVFEPTDDDFTDAGPYGYRHKKSIHDALTEYEKELQSSAPKVDYEGIMKSRLMDLANAPEEHRQNPLFRFAMAMGNPEHAAELVKQQDKVQDTANEKQTQRWQELLDMKKESLEGAIKQSLAEGDARKVVSGKWLEALAQIETDKAKLAGQLTQIGERNAGAERRAELRGQWALAATKARANAMLSATGIREDSIEGRNVMDNARSMLNMLIKKGETWEAAYDKVDEWMEDAIESLRPGDQNVGGAASPAPSPASPTTGRTPAATSSNPMEAAILAGRKSKAP
jgi:hypothetical protein